MPILIYRSQLKLRIFLVFVIADFFLKYCGRPMQVNWFCFGFLSTTHTHTRVPELSGNINRLYIELSSFSLKVKVTCCMPHKTLYILEVILLYERVFPSFAYLG